MRNVKYPAFVVLSLGALALSVPALADSPNTSLDQQLQELSIPTNEAPSVGRNLEKLYAVESRYVPIDGRSELSLGIGKNFNAPSFITSGQINAQYRYHINDKWNLTASGSYVFNSLSDAGQTLLQVNQELPAVAYVKYRADLLAGYNLFYGKFRVSMDQVFYFDQYIAAGPGVVGMDNGTSPAGVGDIGFVFWMGRKYDLQVGMKDYYYRQTTLVSTGMANDVVGHIDFGILLGGGHS